MQRRFGIIGCAGFVAPRHLQAIKETGNSLVTALDPHDSVGILDTYSPEAFFFTQPESFDRYLFQLRRKDKGLDYMSICSPNHLHDPHIRMALRNGIEAICEKPLVVNPESLDALAELEGETGKKIYGIMQLRLNSQVIALKKRVDAESGNFKHLVNLRYVTFRGPWYHYSWKGDEEKSGGIAMNIGIHFFDMLNHVFGEVKGFEVHYSNPKKMYGSLELEKAMVNWFLSIDKGDLVKGRANPCKSITIDNEEFDLSGGFKELHTESYRQILAGNGFGIKDLRSSIELAHNLRKAAKRYS
jgi:UDP-N-acetyl-2-amino-2-deoxyglucuronate dehydrogenase